MAVKGSRRAMAARRRKRRLDRVEHDLSAEQWTILTAAWGGCAYCGETDKPLQRDCVLALSPRRTVHARQHRACLPLLQHQQVQRRSHRLAAAQATRRARLPDAPPRDQHDTRASATNRGRRTHRPLTGRRSVSTAMSRSRDRPAAPPGDARHPEHSVSDPLARPRRNDGYTYSVDLGDDAPQAGDRRLLASRNREASAPNARPPERPKRPKHGEYRNSRGVSRRRPSATASAGQGDRTSPTVARYTSCLSRADTRKTSDEQPPWWGPRLGRDLDRRLGLSAHVLDEPADRCRARLGILHHTRMAELREHREL